MMNVEDLTEYKKGIEAELMRMEIAAERVKLEIKSKREMVKLCERQIQVLKGEAIVNGEPK